VAPGRPPPSGGPATVYPPGAPHCDPKLFDLGIPVLGICYGMQLACQALGGAVRPATRREFGRAVCRVHPEANGLFAGVPSETVVWMSHGDQVQSVGADWVPLADTDTCPLAAVRHQSRPIYGLQFHPEVSHTPHGARVLRNFLHEVCGCRGLWQLGSFLDATVQDLRRRIGP